MVLRQTLILTLLLPAALPARAHDPLAAAASADDSRFSARLFPHATLPPVAPPIDNLPRPLCTEFYCQLDLSGLDEMWKRDLTKRPPEVDYLNADTVLTVRAGFAADMQRFGDPHAPAVFQHKIDSLGVCFGGYIGGEGMGIRTC